MGLRLVPENLHELRLGARRILMHPPTSALFELDAVGAELLDLFRERGEVAIDDVVCRFDGRYPPGEVVDTLSELRHLDIVNEHGRADPRHIPPIRELPLSTIVLNVNTGCNLSCSYCYKEDLTTAPKGRRMDFATAVRSVELLLAQARERASVNIVFFGGEPLSNLALIRQVVDYAERRCAEQGLRPDFSLTTNGTLLTEETVDYLDRHRFGITVSMDGPREYHDRNRVTHKGRGSYDIIRPKVRMLLARYRSRPVGARVTLTHGVTDVVAIHRHLRDELGFFEVGFAPVTSGPIDHYNLDGEELQAVFTGMKRLGEDYLAAALEGRNNGFANLHQLLSDLHEGRRKSLPCGAGIGMLAVDAGGDLHLCHRFTGSRLPTFGNVERGIDRERLSGFLEAAADLSGRGCATCRIRSLCAGGCYHESYARYADPLHPTYHYCELMRDWVDFGVTVYLQILNQRPDFLSQHVAPRRARQ
ncbi:MAG TPA: quinohemoprotein amine dehydrogenase maturation protein [Candidatus Competibacteraceae bacterium]|nr:quinohemoprotein amine dehydrogenase maturation protein [Candidatus Competibacteraceae bacterium]